MELHELTALEQAELVRTRQVSSEALVQASLARIERLNPRLQAFVTSWPQRALRAARKKDAQVRQGATLPPFHGVPLGIKDMNYVRGAPTRMGSRGTFPLWSPIDDLSVRPLRRAGFVFLGKTAAAELGALPVTEPDLHPPTRNPWNDAFTPGGSSGGSAAAVASGMLPAAHGSDGGGSIRLPAAFCGLVGLKPARGRIPNAFGLPDRQLLYTTGALTHTVDDAAALLDVMSGVVGGKPHWAPAPPRTFAQLAREAPGRLRVRLTVDASFVQSSPEARAAVELVARRLESLGHHVEAAAMPEGTTVEDFLPLWQHLIGTVPFVRWSRVQPLTRWLHEAGVKLRANDMLARHRALEARLLAWFEGADLWLTPTVPVPTPPIGAFPQQGDMAALFRRVADLAAFSAVANLTGQPAISVPSGVSAGGLPLGVMLTGRSAGEATLLQVARQLETAWPWPRVAP